MSANNVGEVIYEVNAKTDKIEKQMQDINRKLESESHSGSGAFSEIWTGAARKVGEAFVQMGAKAIGALKDLAASTIQTGMDFEAQMSKVEAISGASGEAMDEITAKAKEMGATTKFTATEAGQAFEYMAMAGWKSEQMVAGIEPILSLAAAAGEDLGTTSDIVTDALTAFGLKAEDAGHFADVLAAASSNANTNVSMMGETFKYAAPIAGALGFSVDDTAEAIGLLANAGIKGSQAGTTLRQIMNKLNGEVKISGKAIGDVTVKTVNADGSMRDLSDILADCRDSFSKLTESEKASAAQALVGRNAMSGFLALMNAAPEDIAKLSSAIDGAEGSAARMAETMADNLKGQLTRAASALDGFKLALFEKLQTPLTDAVKWGTKAIGKLTAAFQEHGLQGVVEEIGAIFTDEFLPFLENLGEQLWEKGLALIRSIGFGWAEGAPELVAGAMNSMDEFLQNLGQKAMEFVQTGLTFMHSLVKGFVDALPEFLKHIPELISNVVGTVYGLLYKIVNSGWDIIKSLAAGLWDNREEILTAVWNTVTESWKKFLSYDWLGLGNRILTDILNGIKVVVPALWGYMKQAAKTAWETFRNINWVQLGYDIITFILTGLGRLFSGIPQKLKEIGKAAVDAFKSVDWLGLGKNVIDGVVAGIKAAPGAIKDALLGMAKGAWNGIKNFFGIHSPSSLMRETVGQPIGEGVAVGITDTQGQVSEAMDDLSKTVYDTALNANVDYALPDLSGYAQDLGASLSYQSATTIEVPLYMDGREIARASAYYMGQQLAWEG